MTDNAPVAHSHFEFSRDSEGQHRWHLQAANNEVVASGEGYGSETVSVGLDMVFWAADALLNTPEFIEARLTIDQIDRLVSAQAAIETFLAMIRDV